MSVSPTSHTEDQPRPLTLLGTGEDFCEGDVCFAPAPPQG